MNCPSCSKELATRSVAPGTVLVCLGCRGILIEPSWLAARFGADLLAELWGRAKSGELSQYRTCTNCEGVFQEWKEPAGDGGITLDACLPCELLWFDAGELAEFKARARNLPSDSARDKGLGSKVGGVVLDVLETLGHRLTW